MSPEFKRGPANPIEAAELQTQQIPDEVFLVFNGLIALNLRDGRSRVTQKDVLAQLEIQGIQPSEAIDRHLLDVEDSYRSEGWHVIYERPVYYAGEDFEPYFEFHAKEG